MRSNTLTVTVERSTDTVTARRNQSLINTLKAHYREADHDRNFGTINWRCAVGLFWSTAVSVLYTTLAYTVPHLVGHVWGLDPWMVYWAKVVCAFGFVQITANWLCLNFYQSYYKVTDDRPDLNKTLWDVHPLEVGKKVDDPASSMQAQDPRMLPWKHCMKCQMGQPPRSHHCKICQKCVLKRDHHCFILGSCIGYYNERNFIIINFYLFIACLISLPLSYVYLRDFHQGSAWDYFLPWTLYNWVWLGGCDLVTLLLVSQWYVLTWLAPMSLSFFILSFISLYFGRTMYEFVKNSAIRVTSSRAENLRSVFGDFWMINFLFPAVILFKQPGDGTEWAKVFRLSEKGKPQAWSSKNL